MKEQSSHQIARQTTRFGVDPLLALLVVVLFSAIASNSTAQAPQDNRQLNRDQAQQSNHTSERRIGLVIGNGAYTNAPPLKNPPNDARDMAATLKTLGFDVVNGINVSQREMKALIRDFGQKLKTGGAGLFYYAGHGVQSKGRNYLIPTDADIQSEAEVEDSGVDVSLVLNFMDDAQNGLNIVILDACRNNPFARSFRSASDGLAQVDAPTGTLIAYATAPGRVASDGTGENGLYTSELLKQMRVPGLSATEMFMRVRSEVMKKTGNKQVPWEASSLVGSFYFSGSASNAPTNANIDASAVGPSPIISEAAKEQALWDAVKDSADPEDLKKYLENYPNGAYASAADAKLRRLERATSFAASSMKVLVNPFSIQLQSCKMSAGEVVCELILTNTSAADKEFDLCHDDYRVVRRGKDVTKATDNNGNRYALEESVIGGARARSGFGKAVLPSQVPVRMTLKFANVAKESTSFSLLRLAIYEQGTGNPNLMMYADFKNVPIQR